MSIIKQIEINNIPYELGAKYDSSNHEIETFYMTKAEGEDLAYIDTKDESTDVEVDVQGKVDLVTNQYVHGIKSFLDGIDIGDAHIVYDTAEQGLVISFKESE